MAHLTTKTDPARALAYLDLGNAPPTLVAPAIVHERSKPFRVSTSEVRDSILTQR
jgi:hypothetical protein